MANTTLTYNGVSIDYIKTNKFEQEAVRDESDTDLILSHITIGVTGVLNNCIQGDLPWVWMDENRSLLLEPRKKLLFYCDGDELIQSPPVGFDSDAKLGPKPKICNITKMDGQTFMIYYEIETWLVDCVLSEGSPQPVLNNRWETNTNIDADFYTTRTINGLMVFNGYYNDRLQPGGALEFAKECKLIVPRIPKGWKRDQVNVKLSADGLKCTYSIVDRQQHFAMPKPAVQISATYSETAGMGGERGIPDLHIQINEINVSVKGQPGSRKTENGAESVTMPQLMKIMMQVVLSRIDPNIAGVDKTSSIGEWITFFSMKEDIFKNEISTRVVTRKCRDPKDTKAALTMDFKSGKFAFTRIGTSVKVADIQNNMARYPDSAGNYMLYLFVAAFQTACTDNKSINKTDYGTTSTDPTTVEEITVTQSTGSVADPEAGNRNTYSDQHLSFPWTNYTLDVTYCQNYHTIQLPVMYNAAPNCIFTQTAAETRIKRVAWKAVRVGEIPLIPNPTNIATDPTTGLVEDKLLHSDVNMACCELESDGFTRRYEISGVYEYGCYRATDWSTSFNLESCVNPITSDKWGDVPTTIPSSKFITGIIGPGPAPGA